MSIHKIKPNVELEVTEKFASAVSNKKKKVAREPEDFVMNRQKAAVQPKLLESRALNESGEIDPKNPLALAKMDLWSNGAKFFLKRLPAGCFFNPWNYNKGTKNDIKYFDKYGRKAEWVEVPKHLYDLYLRFLVGEKGEDGRPVHNSRCLSQVERTYISDIV